MIFFLWKPNSAQLFKIIQQVTCLCSAFATREIRYNVNYQLKFKYINIVKGTSTFSYGSLTYF